MEMENGLEVKEDRQNQRQHVDTASEVARVKRRVARQRRRNRRQREGGPENRPNPTQKDDNDSNGDNRREAQRRRIRRDEELRRKGGTHRPNPTQQPQPQQQRHHHTVEHDIEAKRANRRLARQRKRDMIPRGRRSRRSQQQQLVANQDVEEETELRPGAMQVRDRMENDYDNSWYENEDDDDSSRMSYDYDSDWTEDDDDDELAVPAASERMIEPEESFVVHADVLDEDELDARYRSMARRRIQEQIQAEAPEALVVVTSTNTRVTETGRRKRLYLSLMILLVGSIGIVAVVVGITWNNWNPARSSSSISPEPLFFQSPPTSSPTITTVPSTPPTYFDEFVFMQQELVDHNISDEAIFNITSPQYMALEWLVYNDTTTYNFRFTHISSYLDRYSLAVLYFSTNGQDWNSDGPDAWLSVRNVCRWSDVECDDSDSIVGLVGKDAVV